MLDTLRRDLVTSFRTLRRSPGYAATVIAVLALGVSAVAAAFALFNASFLKPLPGVSSPSQLAVLTGRGSGGRSLTVSYPDYRFLRDNTTAFSALMASTPMPFTVGASGGGERVWGELVSGNYFDVLGVTASLGRTISPSDERLPDGEPVAVISDGLWRRTFAADPGVVGRTILVNAHPVTIVGVVAPGFHGSIFPLALDIFIPLTMQPRLGTTNQLSESGTRWLIPIGRLATGSSQAQAAAETELLAARLAADDPVDSVSLRATVVPLWQTPFGGQSFLVPIVGVLGATAFLVLAIVCANLSNLALARGLARRREIAARLALGASRTSVIRLLMLENLLLALPAAGLGLLASTRLFGLFGNASAPAVTMAPTQFDTSIDGVTIGFAVVVAWIGTVAFSAIPALRGTRMSLADVIKGAGQLSSNKVRLRSALLVAQVAASVLLLVAAGLTLRTVAAARDADLGFDPGETVSIRLDLAPAGYEESRGRTFYEELLDRLRSDSEVEAATLAEFVPLRMIEGRSRQVTVDGYEPARDEDMRIALNSVSSGYFETLRIALLAGRSFERGDTALGAPVVVVNETMARRFWKTPAAAIGRRIRVGDSWRTVVGVARDVPYLSLNERPTPYFYLPFTQDYRPEMTVHVRAASTGADSAIARTRAAIRALDPQIPILETQRLDAQARSGTMLYEVSASALSAFGVIAIGLAAVGVYGLMSFAVRQSQHEIGVRLALGASRSAILRRFVGQGMRIGMAGAILGLAMALMTTRLMAAVLYGVNPFDPAALAGATALVLAVALLACVVPSWRAARCNPVRALRHP